MKKHTFTATIQNSGGGGAFVEVPFDVEEPFGSKRPRVNATNEGVPHRGTLVRMGGPNHILIILKDIREKIGKTFGDKVKIMIEADVQPRVVAIPKNLAGALKKDREAKIRFGKLSQNHKRNRGGDCRLSQRTHLPRPQGLGRDDAGDRGSHPSFIRIHGLK